MNSLLKCCAFVYNLQESTFICEIPWCGIVRYPGVVLFLPWFDVSPVNYSDSDSETSASLQSALSNVVAFSLQKINCMLFYVFSVSLKD